MPFSKSSSIMNLLFLLYLIIPSVSSQDISVFGNVIYDLWAPAANFSAQTAPWNATLLQNPIKKYATCTQPALGGCGIIKVYGAFLRTYTNLPPHNYLFYSFDFYTPSGQWENRVTWSLDDNALLPWYYVCLMSSLPVQNSCGCTQYKASAVGAIPHTASTLTFNFSGFSGVSTAEQSFRNIKIILSNTTTSTATNQVIVNGACKSYTRQNPCLNGEYEDPTNPGTCLNCSAKCSTCYGPSDSECYSCAVPGGFDGSQCISCTAGCSICSDSSPTGCSLCDSSHFLDWQNLCVSSCPSPYIAVYDGLVRKCQTICQASDQFLFWDQTCGSVCPAPFVTRIEGNAKFCDFPCANSEYLLWDNSCNSTCSSPYPSRVQGGENFCDYPCASMADYYYPDENRCDLTCNGDYQDSGIYFCMLNPRCSSTEFYYWNQTCQSSCQTPLIPRTQGNAQFCDFPCPNTTHFYFPTEKVCNAVCPSSHEIVQSIFCIAPQQQEEVSQDLINIKTVHSVFRSFNTILSGTVGLFDHNNPTSFNLFSLLTFLEYIKYMKIQYPPKLQYLLNEKAFDFSFTEPMPDIGENLKDKFSDHLLPANFEKYDHASSFIVNFWESLLFLVMIGLVILLLSIVNQIKFKSARIEKIKKKIHLAIKWNFLFSSLTVLYSSMVLFSSFEFRTLDFKTSNGFDILSFITCLLTNFGTAFMLFKMFHLIYKLRTTPDEIKNASHKKEEFEVVFEKFKSNSFIQQAFMPIFTLRVIFSALVIAYLFEYPFVQAVLLTFAGVFMIAFLIFARPLVEKFELLEYILSETTIFSVNICLVIFAILDGTENDTPEVRKNLGSVIIACNLTLTFLLFVYNCVNTMIMIKEVYSKIKDFRQKLKFRKVQPLTKQEGNPLAVIQIDKSDKSFLVKSNPASAFHIDTTIAHSQRQFDLHDESTSNTNSLIFNRSPSKKLSRFRSKFGSYSKIFPSTPNHSDSEAQSTTHLK